MLEQMRFTGTWRDYQAQLLEEIDEHLDDDRLHVVAAPGAGKTILGLEIIRRLDRPALIFAPTRSIRDQWSQRLVPLFMPAVSDPAAISHDLCTPATLTIATYQALDTLRREEELDALVQTLRSQGR